MTLAYNRTLTPLPADAAGRMIEGRSEGEVDATYPPVERAIASGSIKILGNSEDPEPEPPKKKSSSKKTSSSSSSSSEKKSSSSTKKTSSKKADEPDEEN